MESFFGIGGPELLLIFVLATIVLGPLRLAAALLDGLFEHPASHFDPSGNLCSVVFAMAKNGFSSAC